PALHDARTQLDPAHTGHVQVRQHDFEIALRQAFERVAGTGHAGDRVALFQELALEQVAGGLVVVDHAQLASQRHSTAGKSTSKRLPLPSSLDTSSRPPCSS